MIPPYVKFGLLPPGVHWTTWEEFNQHFNFTERRQRLMEGLKAALDDLTEAGCSAIYIDGSFVTRKAEPNDFDACWSGAGVDATKLDPALLDFTQNRRAMKEKYGGEFFVAETPADLEGRTFLDFFQFEFRRELRIRKGIIGIKLGAQNHDDQK